MKNQIYYKTNAGVEAELNTKNFIYFQPEDYIQLGKELKRFYKNFSNLYDGEISFNEGMTNEETEEEFLYFFANCDYLTPKSKKNKDSVFKYKLEGGF